MELYEHQKEALKKSEGMDHVAYYHDMGLGKTYVGSEKMVQLGAKVNLVICQKSKIDDWVEHFRTNYPDYTVMDLTTFNTMKTFIYSNQSVGIINYDLVWRRKDLLQLKDFTLLLDESSLIQNDTSKRTKFIMKLQPKNVILLSGTPTGGKYETLWTQLHLLGWNISKDLFLKQYVDVEFIDVSDDKSVPVVTGYKNVDRLKRKMAAHGCQFLKTDEVFDLPDQIFQKVKVPASKEYKEFRKKKIITIGEETLVGDTTLTKMLYERQLCGIYSQDKLKALSDLVESTEDRLIIFYNFTEEFNNIVKMDGNEWHRPLSVVNGFEKNLTAYEECDNSITLIQYQSGAKGLNLQKANKIIFYSPTLRCEDWMQSLKRVHRIGQHRPCFYYQLIVKGSVEERIYSALDRGVDYTNDLFEKDDAI